MSMKINGRLDKLSGQQITITADDSVSLYTLSKNLSSIC